MQNLIPMIGQSLLAAIAMFWSILWALILGFFLSGAIMAFVPRRQMVRVLGNARPKSVLLAVFFGALSSSCSYAASSMSRALFQKGAHIVAALAFLLASTNLVLELSLVLWLMMGWQFVVAEFIGGLILVAVMAALMLLFGPLEAFERQRNILEKEPSRSDSIEGSDPRTLNGWRQAARSAVHEWNMIWKDIVLGVTISGFLMVFVPDSFWRSLFMQTGQDGGLLKVVENALVGPLVSVISFVCSVGNIPLASVLYHGGIGFGGAVSFIYADLIIIPIILVYKKYFGWRLAMWITGIFYISMVAAGIVVELLFGWLGWIPQPESVMPMAHESAFALNYTFVLNILFIILGMALYRLAKSNAKPAAPSGCH